MPHYRFLSTIERQNLHLLAAFCAAISLLLHGLYFVDLNYGAGLATISPESDAFFYFYRAWYSANINPDGGMLGEIISPSPYISVLVGVFNLFGFGISQAFTLCALCAVVVVYVSTLLTYSLFESRAVAFFAGLLAALSGVFLFYSGLMFKTSLVLLEAAVACYLTALAIKKVNAILLLVALLVATVASFDREQMILFIPIAIWFFLSASKPSMPIAGKLFVTLTGFLTLTWVMRGLVTALIGSAGIGNSFGVNLMTANAPSADGGYSTFYDFENNLIGHRLGAFNYLCSVNDGVRPSFSQFQSLYLDDWLDFYARYPFDLVKLKLKHFLLMISTYSIGHPEQYGLWRFEQLSTTLAFVDWSLIFSLAVALFIFTPALLRSLECQFFLAFLIIYSLALLVFLPAERYRMMLHLLLIPLAAVQVHQLLINKRRTLPMLISGGIFLLSIFATTQNPVLQNQLAVESLETAIRRKAENYRLYEIMKRAADEQSEHSLLKSAEMMLSLKLYYDAIEVSQRLLNVSDDALRLKAERIFRFSSSALPHSKRVFKFESCEAGS